MMWRGVRNWPLVPAVLSLPSKYSYRSPCTSWFCAEICIASIALHASMSKLGLLILNSALAICSANEPPLPPSVLRNGKTFSLTYFNASSAVRFDQYDQRSFGSEKIG